MSYREQYAQELREYTAQCYAEHILKNSTENTWEIRNPNGSSVFYAEIAALGPYLVVVGDTDTVVFRGSYTGIKLVSWLASSDSYGYLCEKASIGMSGDDHVYEFDADAAREDLQELRETRAEDAGDDALDEEEEDLFKELLGGQYEHPQGLHQQLYDAGITDEPHRVGRVISPRIYYAHAAVKRLWALLKETLPQEEEA